MATSEPAAKVARREPADPRSSREDAKTREPAKFLFSSFGYRIYQSDFDRLAPGGWLNDTIINYCLEALFQNLQPEFQPKVYIFPSFFWTRLTKNPTDDPTKRHERVKKWTKHVDLFAKDLVLFPINENSHWYLAMVCFPGLDGPVGDQNNTKVFQPGQQKNESRLTMVGKSGREKPTARPGESRRWPAKEPRIIVLDSVRLKKNMLATKLLRDYFTREWIAKNPHLPPRKFVGSHHSDHLDSGAVKMAGYYPLMPQQDNSSDCGIYVLEYAERALHFGLPDWNLTPSDFTFTGCCPPRDLSEWFPADAAQKKRETLVEWFSKRAPDYQNQLEGHV